MGIFLFRIVVPSGGVCSRHLKGARANTALGGGAVAAPVVAVGAAVAVACASLRVLLPETIL